MNLKDFIIHSDASIEATNEDNGKKLLFKYTNLMMSFLV